MGLARKITLILLGVLAASGALIGLISYQTSYRQVDESAGIELVGCANITTGLIDPSDVAKLTQGDLSSLDRVESQLNWIHNHKPLFKEAFLLSPEGKILAADENMKARGYKSGDTFYFSPDDQKQLAAGSHTVYSGVYIQDGVRLKTGYGPIYQNGDHSQPIIGLMAINFDASIIQERTWEMLRWPLLTGTLVLLLTVVLLWWVVRRVTAPLSLLSERTNRMAQGDLSMEPLRSQSKDEIGRLSRDFDLMNASLKGLVREVGGTALHVASSAQQLSASAEESGRATQENARITAELQSGTEQQLDVLKESSATLQDMSGFISGMAANSSQVAEAARKASSTSQNGYEAARDASRQMDLMEQKIHSLDETIHALNGQSKQIGEMVDVITAITEETQLLALNAAIEATRAGEHGRGFARRGLFDPEAVGPL